MKAERRYVKLGTDTENSSEGGMRTSIVGRRTEKRRVVKNDSDKTKRVMTPLEAESVTGALYRNLGMETASHRRQALRSKKLHARRSIALSPAPVPVTAPKNPREKVLAELRKRIVSHIRNMDWIYFAVLLAVSAIGILAVHSATRTMGLRRYDIMQIGSFAVGMFLVLVFSAFDYGEIIKAYKLIFWLNVGLLVFTLIFGESVTGDTNRNWVDLGFTKIQPAEFAKILFIMSMAGHLDKVQGHLNEFKKLFGVLCHGVCIIGLVLLEGDVGNALVFGVIFAVMLFCAGIRLRLVFGALALGVCAFPFVWNHIGTFRQNRILTAFNPELDPLGAGHQVLRARSAIAGGGFTGFGYMKGKITQTDLLFAKHTDMIFATIAEEAGFLGAAVLIGLYIVLVYRILTGAFRARDYAGAYICAGVGGLIIFQCVLNIGMCLGMAPVVGITLPFISYGASSLIGLYVSASLVMSVLANNGKYSYRSI